MIEPALLTRLRSQLLTDFDKTQFICFMNEKLGQIRR